MRNCVKNERGFGRKTRFCTLWKTLLKALVVVPVLVLSACEGKTDMSAMAVDALKMPNTNWQLESNGSFVSFLSVKNTNIVESHHFTKLDGGISQEGQAVINLDLSSVQTNIDIRNERLKKHVFKIEHTPLAVISASLDPALYAHLAIGEPMEQIIALTVAMAGHTADYDGFVQITRIANDRIQVQSVRPVLLDADDIDAGPGIEILRGLAKLDNITTVVPVQFSLIFNGE